MLLQKSVMVEKLVNCIGKVGPDCQTYIIVTAAGLEFFNRFHGISDLRFYLLGGCGKSRLENLEIQQALRCRTNRWLLTVILYSTVIFLCQAAKAAGKHGFSDRLPGP
jgi:hypothetical protein